MSGILTYSDDASLAGELSTAAQLLAGVMGETSLLVELDAQRDLRTNGPALIVKSDRPLSGDYELAAEAILEASRRGNSSLILIGATRMGRQVAAKLAVILGYGVLGDVRDLRFERGSLTGLKAVFGGKFNARVGSALPCIVLVSPGAYEAADGPPSSIESIELVGATSRVRHLETRPKSKATLDLKTAQIIVAAGRGFKKKEDLILIEQLAGAVGGAVGSSRPLSSDLGWLGEEYHIGLTGLYVHPRLYLAVGISGQLQHVAGIKDSGLIVAINKDKQAPIFQVADYGIVGDLYQVVPALLRALGAGQG